MITYGSTTLTSYNSIVKTEVYYYKSTSATSLSGGSWSTTKPTWENGKYIWQKIRTIYEDGTHTESDPVNITGQQGATGTAAYSYKLNSSDSIIGKTKDGEYTIKKITFSATYKQGTGAVSAYSGRFKIESTTNGSTWKTEYTSSGNEASKEFTIPDDIIAIKCSLYQSNGTTVLLDIVTVPVVKDGVDAIGLRDSIPYYLASDKDTGITRLTQGWTRYRPQLTAEKKYLWVYYVSRYSEGSTEPELIEIKDDLVHFVNNGDESPVESCVVDIDPVQAGSGDPSPDNVRPITGFTKAKVTRRGKNLMGKPSWTTRTQDGVTATLLEDGRVSVTGTGTNAGFAVIFYNSVDLPAGTYIFNGQNNADVNKKLTLQLYNITDDAQIINLDTATNYTFTLDKPSQVNIRIGLRVGISVTDAILSPMIRHVSSVDPTYEPYESRTHTITFPSEAGTVYGGTLDVTSGVLTVDRVCQRITSAEIKSTGVPVTAQSDSNTTYFNLRNVLTYASVGSAEIADVNRTLSDRFTSRHTKELWINKAIEGATSAGRYVSVRINASRLSEQTAEGLANYLTNGLQILYPLATPQTYQLTPQEITSLLGENNVWADTGDSEVEYRADTKMYVDAKVAAAVSALS